MSLETSSAKLNYATKGFRSTWHQARIGWRDQRALAFEERYVLAIEAYVRAALTTLDRMGGLLTKARRECE